MRNMLHFPAVLVSPLGFNKGSETGLPKMMIRSKSVANAQLAHDSETDAIGEGPLFVAMFSEPVSSSVKTRRINPFHAECLTAFDCIKKIRCRAMTVAHQQQSDGFIGYILGGEEMAALAN